LRVSDANGDTLSITEEGTCIVDIYTVEVSTVTPEPVLDFDWSVLSTFGDYGINSIAALEANGWTTDGINDFQVCGLGGCTVSYLHDLGSSKCFADLLQAALSDLLLIDFECRWVGVAVHAVAPRSTQGSGLVALLQVRSLTRCRPTSIEA
jgi:hypothetical protein